MQNDHTKNVLGTQLLIRHFESYCPKAFFMFSSAVAIYGDRLKNPEIRVSDPLHEDDEDFYVQSKIEAEQVVQHSKTAVKKSQPGRESSLSSTMNSLKLQKTCLSEVNKTPYANSSKQRAVSRTRPNYSAIMNQRF